MLVNFLRFTLLAISLFAVLISPPNASGAANPTPSQIPSVASDDPFLLPEYLVVENVAQRPCLYGEIPGFQIWSTLSEQETKAFVRELQQRKFYLEAVVPKDLWPEFSSPVMLVLNDASDQAARTDHDPAGTATSALRQSLGTFRADDPARIETGNINVDLPLTHADGTGETIKRSPGSATRTVTRRLNSGGISKTTERFTSGVGSGDFDRDVLLRYDSLWKELRSPTTVFTFPVVHGDANRLPFWLTQNLGLQYLPKDLGSEKWPPLANFFPPPNVYGFSHPAHRNFIAWALGEDPVRADSFWKFIRCCQTDLVDDALLRECFGVDYVGLQAAVKKFVRARSPKAGFVEPKVTHTSPPTFPEIVLHPATRAELVRGKSEQERLSALRPLILGLETAATRANVRRQTEMRLERASKDGLNDAQLLSTLALLECDWNDLTKAVPYLEAAAAAGSLRPRVYYELAQARFRAARSSRLGKPAGSLSDDEFSRAFAPLQIARTLKPALKSTYFLAVDLAMRTPRKPSADVLAFIEEGVRLFPFEPKLGHRAALLFTRADLRSEASALADFVIKRTSPSAAEPIAALKRALAIQDETALAEVVRTQAREILQPGRDLTDLYVFTKPTVPPGLSP